MGLANALIRLGVCTGLFEPWLVAHTTFLEMLCRGLYAFRFAAFRRQYKISNRRKAKVINQHKQVLYLTQNLIWKSDTNTQENQEVSHFPTGDHKAARNRQDSITKKILNMNKKTDQQKKNTALDRSDKINHWRA